MRCANCHSDNPSQFQFCGKCGTALAGAERHHLTVMFCEMVNPTTLSEQLDPEDFHDVITTYQETCSAIVRRFSGYVARQIGGASLVYFGYPVAHDDASRQAVRAGLALIGALPALTLTSIFHGGNKCSLLRQEDSYANSSYWARLLWLLPPPLGSTKRQYNYPVVRLA